MVVAIGPEPAEFEPTTVTVYEVPLVSPEIVQVVVATTEHVALPGDAVAVYVASATTDPHDTTAPPSDGNAVSADTCGGVVATYSNLFGVCGERLAL